VDANEERSAGQIMKQTGIIYDAMRTRTAFCSRLIDVAYPRTIRVNMDYRLQIQAMNAFSLLIHNGALVWCRRSFKKEKEKLNVKTDKNI